MVNLPISNSNDNPKNYEKLDPRIQRWIWEKGWDQLRDIQEKAIPLLLEGTQDAILSATTASGKTEAAFFPLLTLAAKKAESGFCLLYISPLKALINDQFDRLEDLAGRVEIKVTPWHGDIDQQVKQKAIKNPTGVLLITPESLEALLDRHAGQVSQGFLNLGGIIVDEVHAFIGSERGRQLQSLLSRLENLTGQTLRRIGLSATLGDMNVAANYLRPENPGNVQILVSQNDGIKLRMTVNGVLEEKDPNDPAAVLSKKRIAENIFDHMRTGHHLVFANSRSAVEEMVFRLLEIAEAQRVPCDFFPHHGSLSKEIREDAESRLKNPSMPATAVCTSTLELGIDIGQVKSIVQLGEAPSVSSLRQRIGRSGRRGEPAILRVFVEEPLLQDSKTLPDRLNLSTFRVSAQIELLLNHWVETPRATEFHLSTLVHQVLALICERGSIRANTAYEYLCSKGAFRNVNTSQFIDLLRCMGKQELIVQSHDGDLVIGIAGEKLTSSYEFFAVFVTPENYEVVAEGRTLGELSASFIVFKDMSLIFAGRPWRVSKIDSERKIIYLESAKGGVIPHFEGSGWLVDDKIVAKERELYLGDTFPKYLDPIAIELFSQARSAFKKVGLDKKMIVRDGDDWLIFPWRGTRTVITLQLMLKAVNVTARRLGEYLSLPVRHFPSEESVLDLFSGLSQTTNLTVESLAQIVEEKKTEKYHWVLNDILLAQDFAAKYIEIDRAFKTCEEILKGSGSI